MAAFNPAAFDNAAFDAQALIGGAFDATAFDNDGFYTGGASAPVVPGFDASGFDAGGFWTGGTVTPPPAPQPGGGPALGGYTRKARKYEQTKAERDEEKRRERAEFFARIEREAAEEAGLRAPDAASRSGAGGSPYSLHASTPVQGDGETREATDGFSQALLARLLASPVDFLSRPVQPFPYVISAGRAAALEAARQRAVQLRDDDEAVTALLLASVL